MKNLNRYMPYIVIRLIFLSNLVMLLLAALLYFAWITDENRADNWPSAEATVISSEFDIADSSPDEQPYCTVDITYTFAVDGVDHTKMFTTNHPCEDTQPIIEAYPPGKAMTILYDRANPTDSVFGHEPNTTPSYMFYGVLFLQMMFTVLTVLIAFVAHRLQINQNAKNTTEDATVSAPIKLQLFPAWMMLILLLINGALFLGATASLYTEEVELYNTSQSWIATSGVVTESDIILHNRCDSCSMASCTVSIMYVFEADGVTYTGNRLGTSPESLYECVAALELISEYPPERTRTVMFNPDDPSSNFIEDDTYSITSAYNLMVLGGIFFACSTVVLGLSFLRPVERFQAFLSRRQAKSSADKPLDDLR